MSPFFIQLLHFIFKVKSKDDVLNNANNRWNEARDAAGLSKQKTMSLNPPALVAFWEALRNNRTEVKADAMIALPEGTYLLGNVTMGSRIYIRHCYPDLWTLCWEMIHDEVNKLPHLVILGNPGIGKTFFGYVILLHLARAGATVVYESGILHKRFLFSHNAVAQGS